MKSKVCRYKELLKLNRACYLVSNLSTKQNSTELKLTNNLRALQFPPLVHRNQVVQFQRVTNSTPKIRLLEHFPSQIHSRFNSNQTAAVKNHSWRGEVILGGKIPFSNTLAVFPPTHRKSQEGRDKMVKTL